MFDTMVPRQSLVMRVGELSFSLLALNRIGFFLNVTPFVLDSEGFNFVFKAELLKIYNILSYSVIFKGLGGTYDGILVGYDGTFEVSLTLTKSLVLFLEVG